jgi:SET domain-containing protein 6
VTAGVQFENFADYLQGVELDVDEDGDTFIIERDSGAPNEEGRLIEEAKMTEFPELEEELKDALKVIKKHKPDVFADKKQRDGIINAVITQVLTDKLAEYPTSIKEDRAMLKTLQTGTVWPLKCDWERRSFLKRLSQW